MTNPQTCRGKRAAMTPLRSSSNRHRRVRLLLATLATLLLPGVVFSPIRSHAAAELSVDFSRPVGVVRALHGINKGPIAAGGLVDVTAAMRALGVPCVRLHDCHWPNPDVVDVHAVFPNPAADPEQAASYEFALTDEYVAATRQTGAEIVYRLGESIEHTATKRFAHPPSDPARWANVCLGIIRHYNEGWAGGFRHSIRYWEIWNEPENRPAMWSGSDEDYFALYRAAARAIKSQYPGLKVGGPAVGASGEFRAGQFQPTAFVTNFLALCRQEALPLDFFSWHCYTADTSELVQRAAAIRRLLDTYGFTNTASHLNEWNYLPGNTWAPIARTSAPAARQAFYEQMAGARGAAFLSLALIELQDAPVQSCNLFHGELGGFGLFNEHGVPQKNYHALHAFRGLLDAPRRVATQGGTSGKLGLAAGLNAGASEAVILLSNFAAAESEFQIAVTGLPWPGEIAAEIRVVDAGHDLKLMSSETLAGATTAMSLRLESPAVALIRLKPKAGAK